MQWLHHTLYELNAKTALLMNQYLFYESIESIQNSIEFLLQAQKKTIYNCARIKTTIKTTNHQNISLLTYSRDIRCYRIFQPFYFESISTFMFLFLFFSLILSLSKEPFFTYFFGVREPGFYGAVNISSGQTTLFMPRLPAEYATWMGRLWTPDDMKQRYCVDSVRFVDEVSVLVRKLADLFHSPFQTASLILETQTIPLPKHHFLKKTLLVFHFLFSFQKLFFRYTI